MDGKKGKKIGASEDGNESEVVQAFYDRGGPKSELYIVGTGSWKSMGNVPYCTNLEYHHSCFKFNTFLHGANHWLEYSSFNGQRIISIVCFDFENDMFREVPSPPKGDDQFMLGVIEDSLCACCFCDDDPYQFDIWVMKDYGVKESWTKQFRIEHTFLPDRLGDYYYPLILLKNGRMLMSHNDQDVCYNLKEKRFKKTDISAKQFYFYLSAYTPCFVSLKDVAKGEQISR
ncbi:hypothetical protein COLO4_16485 [Corchorus olitorius]|uniref:F-box associated beta-propeller type 1 domain-containing protein n=1 Tax=Corchorus olitorius TaxID=93759 RepID=A0A1R3JH90_9ROSI|nr:hypothetical protein COLO4_16485 [Corchorus olitorius]